MKKTPSYRGGSEPSPENFLTADKNLHLQSLMTDLLQI